MPKRSNPFGDCSPLQFKSHIGVKELATGSRHEELMKDVFEETHKKLFSGAQSNGDVNQNHMPSLAAPSQSPLDAASRFEPMQMLLDGGGLLVSPVPQTSHALSLNARQCGEFNGWVDCSNAASAARSQSPLTAVHSAPAGQMLLDSSGHLTVPQHSDMECDTDVQTAAAVAVQNNISQHASEREGLQKFGFKSSKQLPKKAREAQVCETCRRVPGGIRCQFCERAVCQGCVRQCDVCTDHFCQLCSTVNYDAAMERSFCLGCKG